MTEAPPSTAPPSSLDRATTEAIAWAARHGPRLNPRAAITGAVFLAIIGLAIWYMAFEFRVVDHQQGRAGRHVLAADHRDLGEAS
jgi:hypothetical protein